MTDSPKRDYVMLDWGELEALELPPADYILNGLVRGEVGMIQAITNGGKTSLGLNICMALATGIDFLTIVPTGPPRKIIYLDYETPLPRLRDDLRIMQQSLTEDQKLLFRSNFRLYPAMHPDTETLALFEEAALDWVIKKATDFQADLIVIDPITLAFPGLRENENDEVTARMYGPLRKLAKDAGSLSILFCHHIGKEKSEEGAGGHRNGMHRSRGASSFAGLARLIIQLDRRENRGFPITEVSCEKDKTGQPFETVQVTLEPDVRWFQPIGDDQRPKEESSIERVVRAIHAAGKVKRKDLTEMVAGMSDSTIDRCLKKALFKKWLMQPEHGVYQVTKLAQSEVFVTLCEQTT